MRYTAGLFLFVIAAFIGLKLPDFDLAFRWYPLIMHRSLLTHSFLIPLLLFATLCPHVIGKQADPRLRLPLMGFCLALAVHFCFDLFPGSWRGFARIHIPLAGWVGVCAAHQPLFSFFALVTLVPLSIGAFLLPRRLHDPDSPSDAISRWKRS